MGKIHDPKKSLTRQAKSRYLGENKKPVLAFSYKNNVDKILCTQ